MAITATEIIEEMKWVALEHPMLIDGNFRVADSCPKVFGNLGEPKQKAPDYIVRLFRNFVFGDAQVLEMPYIKEVPGH
jgi:hypothetical protein